MTIVRQKTHSQNFVILHKAVLFDKDLSLKAKGLWAYLMSLPDHWHINCREVATHMSDGRDSVLSGLRELVQCGYAQKIQPKKDDGTFGHGGWIIFESKQQVSKEEKPCTENPDAANSYTETAPIVNIYREARNEEVKEEPPIPLKGGAADAAVAESTILVSPDPKKEKKMHIEKLAVRDHVMLTPEELESLKVLHGQSKLSQMLDTLDSWKGSTGKKYKSDYHTLKPGGWVYRRYVEENSAQEKKLVDHENDIIPYDTSIALMRKKQGEDAYLSYLETVTDKKYYNEYIKSKEKQ